MIGRAAHEVGMADLTIRSVADHLGVSVAGLYHHIDGKDDLLRLAAEYSATRRPTPVDRGQHWAVWLLEWANHSRDAFLEEPGLLGQFIEGAISADAIADNVDAIFGLLVRQGFTIVEARTAFALVSSCAVGSAVGAIRQARSAALGRPVAADHVRVLAQRGPDDLPYLRQLTAEAADRDEPFVERITTVLVGIAVERGEAWSPIVETIRDLP
jgi:AcrR family transcriptional regulator